MIPGNYIPEIVLANTTRGFIFSGNFSCIPEIVDKMKPTSGINYENQHEVKLKCVVTIFSGHSIIISNNNVCMWRYQW